MNENLDYNNFRRFKLSNKDIDELEKRAKQILKEEILQDEVIYD